MPIVQKLQCIHGTPFCAFIVIALPMTVITICQLCCKLKYSRFLQIELLIFVLAELSFSMLFIYSAFYGNCSQQVATQIMTVFIAAISIAFIIASILGIIVLRRGQGQRVFDEMYEAFYQS